MTINEATPAQREAITTNAPRVLVLAGPGSGKTATLIARIRRLIDAGVQPSEIVAITFTNAAAREMEHRLSPEGSTAIQLGHCGTLHSFCLRLLREHGGFLGYGDRLAIISPESAVALLQSKAVSLGVRDPIEKLVELKAKGRPQRGIKLDIARTAVAAYYDELKESGVVDFDVILSEALELLRTKPLDLGIKHLFDDETQDHSAQDWDIIEAIPAENKFLVGDPDQGIYSFRGGDIEEIIATAAQKETTVIKLEANFRSHAEICTTANLLIENNRNRVPKVIVPTKGTGGRVEFYRLSNEGEEIGKVCNIINIIAHEQDVGPKEIAILARTNAIANNFRKTLAATGLPVIQKQTSSLPRDWPFARSVVELMANPNNDTLAFFYLVALYREKGASEKDANAAAHAVRKAAASVGKSINAANIKFRMDALATDVIEQAPSLGVSAESVRLMAELLKELPDRARALDLALVCAQTKGFEGDGDGEGITVSSIHAAKGREWDVVFVVGFEDQVIPGRAAAIMDADKRIAAIEEERRLAFVAVTRARKRLFITTADSRVTPWGKIATQTPSRFVREMGGPL